MMTDEMRLKNYTLFIKKLNELGIDTTSMEERIGTKLTNATFTHSNDNGLAYDGSLLNVVLRTLTPYAVKINNLLPDHIKVAQESVVKVSLLIHLSKCEFIIPNDNQWEIDKRGLLYKYAKSDVSLRMGMKSIILAQELGITFTPQEIEAMTILDRDPSDEQALYFSSPLATVIKQANELTFLTNRFNLA